MLNYESVYMYMYFSHFFKYLFFTDEQCIIQWLTVIIQCLCRHCIIFEFSAILRLVWDRCSSLPLKLEILRKFDFLDFWTPKNIVESQVELATIRLPNITTDLWIRKQSALNLEWHETRSKMRQVSTPQPSNALKSTVKKPDPFSVVLVGPRNPMVFFKLVQEVKS